ncbi:MAG: hypothetical protein AB7U83_01145 [Vicinamibacterales bacterium]
MRFLTTDLDVTCQPSAHGDAAVAFLAERLAPARGADWFLYLTTDQTVVDIRHVEPLPLGDAMFAGGALGLRFPSAVRAVCLDVAGGTLEQHWRFWLDAPPPGGVTEQHALTARLSQEPS